MSFRKPRSAESRKKISDSHKNNPLVKASLKRAVAASAVARKNNGISIDGRKSMSKAQKNNTVNTERLRELAKSHIGVPRSSETKERIRNSVRQSPRAQAQRLKMVKNKKETAIERATREYLSSREILFVSQYPIDRFTVDFFLPIRNIAIECDGKYWHSLPETIERDARKDTMPANWGVKVVRIPEGEGRNKGINVERILSEVL